MTTSPLAAHFRSHFGHRDHLYGILLAELADDLDAGGPTAQICRDHLHATRADAVQLRLLAGIFELVLAGDAPELMPFYPSLGGSGDPRRAWPLVRAVLERYPQALQDSLARPPQTNEVGRSACLAVGLFAAVRAHGLDRVRLLEPGASAGLNLNVDRYRIVGPGWAWGPARSVLVLDTQAAGVVPAQFSIVERRGCDIAPIDAAGDIGARRITSYVWPFDLARHDRLRAALSIIRRHGVAVDSAPASTWLAEQLARPVADGVLTVIWQSITQQYWPQRESSAVADLVAASRDRIPLAHLTMEGVPPVQGAQGYTIAEHGPLTSLDGIPVARSHHHGPPVILTDQKEPRPHHS